MLSPDNLCNLPVQFPLNSLNSRTHILSAAAMHLDLELLTSCCCCVAVVAAVGGGADVVGGVC